MLTERDLTIFRALSRYRYLRSTYLHAFAGGASETRFKERLGDLFHEGYLDRPSEQWRFAGARHVPVIYELGRQGHQILADHGTADESRTFLAQHAHRQFPHSVMICEVIASIELATHAAGSPRFIPWPEILARAPEQTRALPVPFRIPVPSQIGAVIPDGLFGLEYRSENRKSYRFFALEADRGTMPIVRSRKVETSYLGKLAAYRDILDHQVPRACLGIPNLLVLTVATSEARMREIIRKLEERAGGNAAFLFMAIAGDTRPLPHLLLEPWVRAGHPPLRIDE